MRPELHNLPDYIDNAGSFQELRYHLDCCICLEDVELDTDTLFWTAPIDPDLLIAIKELKALNLKRAYHADPRRYRSKRRYSLI